MTCSDCERHKASASMWRNEAYKHAGTPLPWEPEELLRKEYERGFIDGMQEQAGRSVDRAVNAMVRKWEPLTEAEKVNVAIACGCADVAWMDFADAIEAKLKEKNAP